MTRLLPLTFVPLGFARDLRFATTGQVPRLRFRRRPLLRSASYGGQGSPAKRLRDKNVCATIHWEQIFSLEEGLCPRAFLGGTKTARHPASGGINKASRQKRGTGCPIRLRPSGYGGQVGGQACARLM